MSDALNFILLLVIAGFLLGWAGYVVHRFHHLDHLLGVEMIHHAKRTIHQITGQD